MVTSLPSTATQIGDHMVQSLSRDDFVVPIMHIDETEKHQLLGPFDSGLRDDEGTVIRTYLPEYAVDESMLPRISILPAFRTSAGHSRGHMKETYFVDSVVHQRLANPFPEDTPDTSPENVAAREEEWVKDVTKYGDYLQTLAQQVATEFEKRTAGNCWYVPPGTTEPCARAAWLEAIIDASYQRADVESKHIMFVLIRHRWLTYRGRKSG